MRVASAHVYIAAEAARSSKVLPAWKKCAVMCASMATRLPVELIKPNKRVWVLVARFVGFVRFHGADC